MTRATMTSAARIVVKVGSSSLTLADGGIDVARIAELAEVVGDRMAAGGQVILVSSGAIAAGFPAMGLGSRPRDLPGLQAAASVGQGLLIAQYAQAFSVHGRTVGQVLLTADDFGNRGRYRSAQGTLNRLVDLGVVPIVNENDTVATDEIRYGDNDRLAALVAHLVHADALILASDVAGLFDGPPSQPRSRLIPEVGDGEDLSHVDLGGAGSGVGSGGMATKVQAARIATASGIPVVLTSAESTRAALEGEPVGTYFHPAAERVPTRQLWIGFATTSRGTLVIDAGAVRALVRNGSSLLPAGILSIDGDFLAGDAVDLVEEDGRRVARGLVNFDSSELPALLGRSTRDLARELGPEYEREVIHRDDLVITRD